MTSPFVHDFTDKVVVVTGAGGVLCSYFAKEFARAGAKVALLDLNLDNAQGYADSKPTYWNCQVCKQLKKLS